MRGILLIIMLFLSSFVKVFSQNEEIPVPKCAIPPNVLETLKDAKDKSEIDFIKIKNLNSTVLFTWPIVQASGYNNPSFWGISNYIDHNSTYGDLQDYNCGTRTYDVSGYNHTGTDIFPAPFGWTMMDNQEVDIVAAADGIIIYKADGNYDRNCDFSNPNWNAIYVRHADNTVTMYGHMKNGSLTSKVVGATVSQGEFLGKIGSSGNSTGPHLHFEVYDSNYNTIDPWSGSCNPVSSKWITQKPYNDSGLLRVMTHSAPPSFGTSCGVSETTNQKITFNVNEVVYGIAYFRTPRSGQSAQMKVYDSNNSLIRNFTIYLSDYDYWAYYWQNFTIPSNATSGTWKIETTYMGQINNIYFNVIGCTQPMPPTTTSANRCGTGSVTLSASGCSGTYNWYATSSGGTSLASTVSYTTPSISATTNYYVDCTVGSCTSSRTAATATINAVPTAPTLSASPTTITSGQNSTLSASNCSGTVTWSNSLGTGTSKSVSPTATTTYTATCTVNGCTSSNGSVTVNTCNLSAPTTTSTNRCGTGSVTLSASGCSGTYNWYSASSGGTSLASTANYVTPSISSTTNYYVSCTVGSCTSSRATATATIKAIPTAPSLTASPSTITSGQSSTLSALGCSGTVTWSNSLGTGTSKTVSPATTTTYTATCTANGCTSANGSVIVTVSSCNVSVPTTTSANRCGTGVVTLSASGCSGTYNWYAASSGGTSLANTANYVTPSINLTTNYYVSCTVGSCTSTRTVTTATIKAIPSAPALSASPATISSGQSSTLSATNCSGTVTWSNSLGTGISKTVSPTLTTTYTATCTVNGCTSTNGNVTVTVSTSNPCPNTVTHSGNVPFGIYKAAQTISSTGNVATGTSYQAGNAIYLNPGFSAGGNETFNAIIAGCTPTIPTNGLVAYYSFNYLDGFKDLSTYNNSGALWGIPTSMNRKQPYDAFQWGGVSSNARRYEVNNASQIQFSNTMSISFWYNLASYTGMDGYGQSSTNGYHVAIGKEGDRNGFYIGVSNDATNNKQMVNFTNNNNNSNNFNLSSSPSGTNLTNLNVWNHVVCTVENNTIKMYINGALANSTTATPNFTGANAGKLYIGTMWALNSTWYPFNGGIDELRLYNRALTPTEVTNLYNAEK